MPKPFINYHDQIALLKKKHLVIRDDAYAEKVLSQIGYFSLINGYKHLFKNMTTRMYRDGVTLEDIVSLYSFDEALRHLFLRYLLTVERNIKARVAYVFCEEHGNSQDKYLDINSYNSKVNRDSVLRLIHTLSHLANDQTDYSYITHHQQNHKNVPLWVLINAMTFGSVSKMFGFLTQNLQSKICRDYRLNIRQMDQILSVLTKYRNACAHGERLFSYKTKDDIPNLSIHAKLEIPTKGHQYIYGKHDLFAVVIAFRYLLPPRVFLDFKKVLSKEIDSFTKQCASISSDTLLKEMGFPLNWKSISRKRL